jgi:hypothetical protein
MESSFTRGHESEAYYFLIINNKAIKINILTDTTYIFYFYLDLRLYFLYYFFMYSSSVISFEIAHTRYSMYACQQIQLFLADSCRPLLGRTYRY